MRICYIKQAENVDEYINYTSKIKINFIKKIISVFKNKFNIITVKPLGDGIIFFIPNKKNKIKLANKVAQKLKYYNINDIVIENNLHIDDFKNTLYENNINILDGRWLFKYLIIEVLRYIADMRNEELSNQEISLLVNDLDEINVNIIYDLAESIKRLNIVTNDLTKLKNIENKLYEQKGIMITVTNNKRKSLAKAKLIFNMDFPEEILNSYNINKKAILINVENKIKVKNKSFNGINIGYYNIKIDGDIIKKFMENNLVDNFDKTILYESILYSKNRYHKVREKIIKDKIEIKGLIGNNGIINEKEFKEN